MRKALILGIVVAVAGCTTLRQPSAMIPQATADWRSVATADDRARLHDWRPAFVGALAAARAAGHGDDIAREGALLAPDSALPGPPIPDGDYRCRIIKLGAKSKGLLDYVAYSAFTCRIDTRAGVQGKRRHFTKMTGSQRAMGIIFPDSAMRQILLGTMVLGDEQRAMAYGVDESRDVAGMIERIGPSRWRLVLPRPHFESQIDVIELVPVQ
ncbi:MAG: DUF4893 domain-containing protein [Sphingomicrobium sp.]